MATRRKSKAPAPPLPNPAAEIEREHEALARRKTYNQALEANPALAWVLGIPGVPKPKGIP